MRERRRNNLGKGTAREEMPGRKIVLRKRFPRENVQRRKTAALRKTRERQTRRKKKRKRLRNSIPLRNRNFNFLFLFLCSSAIFMLEYILKKRMNPAKLSAGTAYFRSRPRACAKGCVIRRMECVPASGGRR